MNLIQKVFIVLSDKLQIPALHLRTVIKISNVVTKKSDSPSR